MRIELIDLHKSFGTNKVLDGLNLTIEAGEVCVILGRSGTGKSVLLKHLLGLMKPDSGQILIDGKDIARLPERDLYAYRLRFGMIFQNAGLLASLNVEQNVALPLIEVRGANQHSLLGLVQQKLAMVGMEGTEKQSVTTLSGGQRKRVAIARALIQEADCMLFDEPTAGLDPPISQTVDDVILKVNRETGCTAVLVTHDLISAFYVGTTVHLFHGGKVVHSGTADEFVASEKPEVREFLARGIDVTQARRVSKSRDEGVAKAKG